MLYLWELEFLVLVLLFCIDASASGRRFKRAEANAIFFLGALVQNVGYLLELTAPTLEAAIVSVKIQYSISLAAIEQQHEKRI